MSRLQFGSDNWTTEGLMREAFGNVFSPRSKFSTILILVILLGVMLSGFRSIEIYFLTEQVSEMQENGRNVIIAQGGSPEAEPRIERRSCDSLVEMRGVAYSGVLMDRGREWFPQLGASIPVFAASPTLISELKEVDIVIGSELVNERVGVKMKIAFGRQTLDAIVGSKKPSGLPVNSAIVVNENALTSVASNCYIILQPKQRQLDDISLISSRLVIHDHPVIIAPVAAGTLDPYEQFWSRPAGAIAILLGVLLGALLALSARLRSSELATYRLSGTGRISALRMLSFESATIAGVYWLSGAASSSLLFGFGMLQTISLLADHLVVASTAVLTSMFLYIAVTDKSAIDLAKDR